MPHPAPAHKSFSDRTSLYQEITDKIIRELEQGRVPWVQPWLGSAAGVAAPLGLPKNAATGRPYSGINILILWSAVAERGFIGQNWLTFRQALKIGAHVRKGERGITVVYADRFIPVPRTHARRRDRRRARRDPVPQALHGLQCRSVRGSSGRDRAAAGTACRKPDPAAGRGADPGDRRRYPHRRQPRLLRPKRRLHPGAAAFGVLRADQLAPDSLP